MFKRKTLHQAKVANIDIVMMEWIYQRRGEGVPLNGDLIMQQAQLFHQQVKIKTPCARGWLRQFKICHGLNQLKICSDKKSADSDAAENFVEVFTEFIKNQNLTTEQIYNANKTALYWK